jgi:DNA-3-methyladenine glycosylase I
VTAPTPPKRRPRAAGAIAPAPPVPTPGNVCPWANSTGLMRAYHDLEWGVPSHDDRHLFEMLILEGAQAGLSWSTVLAKRAHYREVFNGFDPERVAAFGEAKLAALMEDPGIVRNRLKLASAVRNAQVFLNVAADNGSFDAYLWRFVDGAPVDARPKKATDVPARSVLSDTVSSSLKREGFNFVGTTIAYAFLQGVGVINDHLVDCAARRAA